MYAPSRPASVLSTRDPDRSAEEQALADLREENRTQAEYESIGCSLAATTELCEFPAFPANRRELEQQHREWDSIEVERGWL